MRIKNNEEVKVGEVVAIKGTKISLRVFDASNKETLFQNGVKFKGISIREHVIVRRGFKDIVCIVEGEQLDESKYDVEDAGKHYIRTVEILPVGYFDGMKFHEGIKFMPMIKDPVYLVSEKQIKSIYGNGEDSFIMGELLKEEIRVSLPWQKLFNSHVGIFGNTGSGKSNTLAKLYKLLFDEKKSVLANASKFLVLDFNGEYTNNQLVDGDYKNIIQLNTRTHEGQDKLKIRSEELWDIEILRILFKATSNTQTPFLNRVVNGRERYKTTPNSLDKYLLKTFELNFTTTSKSGEALTLLSDVFRIIDSPATVEKLNEIIWNSTKGSFYYFKQNGTKIFFDAREHISECFGDDWEDLPTTNSLDQFDQLIVRCYLQLIRDLISGYVQFDFISPLLKRIDSVISNLRKVIIVSEESEEAGYGLKFLDVISLRGCNSENKKILPLLIAKQVYSIQKNTVGTPPDRTFHLIIDEAHNILSKQSVSEEESWKDYRLELFEEIIKEGRKFGFFLTVASQRPADISPTIMSQIHNFFIHRLVNDKDLFLIDNTISTLDTLSKSMIPNLSTGSCILTGVSFDLPLVLQVDELKKSYRPDSSDVNLKELWK